MSLKTKTRRVMEIPVLRPEIIITKIWVSFLNAADKRTPEDSVTSQSRLLLMLLVFML